MLVSSRLVLQTPFQGKEAFKTHFNYADCLASLTQGVTLKYGGLLSKCALPYLDTKKNLIELTKKSLDEEYKIVQMDNDFSFASTCWLPVKAYYLFFNLLLTIEYILNPQRSVFSSGHGACVGEFTRKLSANEIIFSERLLNQVFDQMIFSHHETPGANLKRNISFDRRYKLVLAKTADYKFEEWQRRSGITSFRSTDARTCRAKFLRKFQISIFEFPYYMRLRANYKDFAFIEGVSVVETAKYFNSYYAFVLEFYRALNELKSALIKMRT